MVGSSPDGGYATLGRAVSCHLGKHIPGNPVVVVQNRSGAGGIVPAHDLFKIAAKDGTVIGTLIILHKPEDSSTEPPPFMRRFAGLSPAGVAIPANYFPTSGLAILRKRATISGGVA